MIPQMSTAAVGSLDSGDPLLLPPAGPNTWDWPLNVIKQPLFFHLICTKVYFSIVFLTSKPFSISVLGTGFVFFLSKVASCMGTVQWICAKDSCA